MSEELQKIWDFCDTKQREIVESERYGISPYHDGAFIAYRSVQYQISGKCSDIGGE